MAKVFSISSHPRFGLSPRVAVQHDNIVGLDKDPIENEFMEEYLESRAVVKFLCDMGFIVHNPTFGSTVATFKNGEFPSDWVSLDVPPSFAMLSYACGLHAFRNKDLTRPQAILIGKLGIAANQASFMWKQKYRLKIA